MDLIDVQILRKLSWNPDDPLDQQRGLQNPWDIARELQIHGTTVKRRLEDMEAAGIIQGVHLWPDLSAHGICNVLFGFHFETHEAKRAAVDGLYNSDVTDIYSFLGKEAWFGYSGTDADDASNWAKETAAQYGAIAWEELEARRWDHEAPTALEGRVMAAFRDDAFRPISEAAEEVGVTPATIRRRLDALRKKRAYVLYPSLFPGRMEGLIPFMITARSTGRQANERLLTEFPEAVWRSLPRTHRPHVLLAATSTQEMARLVQRAEGIAGLSECRHLLLEDSRPCHPDGQRTRISQILTA